MPMFQVDNGRAVVVQPVRPAAFTFGQASRALTEHLDTLLGEQLLPVRVRSGSEDRPYLLAVDCSGHPVVVEVTALLDDASVVRALRYTGQVARMSLLEIGALHPEGRERFSRDLALFRESVPVASLGGSVAGVRLLLVCSEVGEGMGDVVEALTQPGRGVDVLQVGMLDAADGAPLLDVSPVRRPAPSPGPVRTAAPAGPVTVPARSEGASPVARTPSVPVPAVPVARGGGEDAAAVTRALSVITPDGIPARVSTGVRMAVPAVPASNGRAASMSAWSAREPAADAPASFPAPAPAAEQDPPDAGTRHLGVEAPHRAPARGPDARLVSLAAARGGAVVLVWWRRRRDVLHEAMLHGDGSIELADGTRVTDPSAAAEIVSGSHVPVDGWQVWRVADREGPSLADAVGPTTWA